MKGPFFTYTLTYGGAVASLFYPLIGVMIYICFAIIEPPAMWYWSVPPGNYARIVAIAALIGWTLKGFGDWRLGRAAPVFLALAGYLLWSAAGIAFCSHPPVAQHFVIELAKVFLPFVAGLTLMQSVKQVKQLAWVIVLSQGYLAYEFNVSYYQGWNRVQQAGFAGLDNNSIAISMAAGVGFAFFLGLREKILWRKALAFLCATLEAHVIMFSFSRGGLLALIITGIVGFLLVPKKPMYYVVFALAVVLGLRLAGPQVRERFATVFVDPEERDASASSRLEMWKDCLDVMRRKPIMGCGPDHWPIIAPEYGWNRGKEAHSLWLQIGAELGIPGLGFLLAFYGICMWRLWLLARPRARLPDPWLKDAARMVIAALVGFGVAAQFVSLEGLEVPFYITLVGAGALKMSTWRPTLPAGEMPLGAPAENAAQPA